VKSGFHGIGRSVPRQQLGLQMKAEKVPVSVFVVDSAEKPAALYSGQGAVQDSAVSFPRPAW